MHTCRASSCVPCVCSLFALSLLPVLLVGCSSGGSSTPPPATNPVVILGQPQSQTIPINRPATFTVTATGTAPLAYQWTKNGATIAGATSSSYTTPTVALASSGDVYQVTVSNSVNSVLSQTATLTAGPRAPAVGDLRYLLFQQISTPGFLQNSGLLTDVLAQSAFSATNVLGTPLGIGSTWVCVPGVDYDCAWPLQVTSLPAGQTGLAMTYKGGAYSAFASDLASIFASNRVITSFDLEPACLAYGLSYVQTSQSGGFDSELEVTPLSGLQAAADADGAASRILTALSIDANGDANFVSTGWQSDRTTTYETQVLTASADTASVAAAATQLAGQGYIITAFGGNDTQGYLLVGTRATGETLPRQTEIFTSQGTQPTADLKTPYFTTVINVGFGVTNVGQVIVNER